MAKIYWLDLETTGLDALNSTILEIAVAEADFDSPFNYKHIYQSVVAFSKKRQSNLSSFIIDMHSKNGLLEDCANSSKTIEEIEEELVKLLEPVDEKDKNSRHIMAGSSIHFDMGFIKLHMPKLAKMFTYRLYDASSIKLFCSSLGMSPILDEEIAHRAKDDIDRSIKHTVACTNWLKNLAAKQDLNVIENECTGTTAVWCPVHGDCRCEKNECEERSLEDENCPLHSSASLHGHA